MDDVFSELGTTIDQAYDRLSSSQETKRAFAKLVETECADTLRTAADLVKRDVDGLLVKWSEKTVEKYFELAAVLLLSTESDTDQLALFSDLTSQLDCILKAWDSEKAKQGARALLESLIVAIEDLHPDTSREVLQLLARLANAPEGVIPPSEQEGKPLEARDPDGTIDSGQQALLRGLLHVGLYSEVSTFLQQKEELRDVHQSGDALAQILTPTVSFISRKGGVGKSTLAFATAVWYLKDVKPEARVCLLDLDLSGPIWQYLLFPEKKKPSHFLNDLLDLGQGNQKGDFGFPDVSTALVEPLLEKSAILVEGRPLWLLSVADLPRTNRYLWLAIANNSGACFRFLVDLLAALEPLVDFVVIDNGPGFGCLPHLSHVLATSVANGCSAVVSTPAVPDLRGTIVELSDLYVLDRDFEAANPPLWIVNKSDDKARAFFATERSIVDLGNEMEAYHQIVPERPLINRAASPVGKQFCCLPLPLDLDLLGFGNLNIGHTPRLRDALATFITTPAFFAVFVDRVGQVMLPLLTRGSKEENTNEQAM